MVEGVTLGVGLVDGDPEEEVPDDAVALGDDVALELAVSVALDESELDRVSDGVGVLDAVMSDGTPCRVIALT